MDFLSNFVDCLNDHLATNEISASAFCKTAGISVSGLPAVLAGKTEPSLATVIKCADPMHCSADYLLGLADPPRYTPTSPAASFPELLFALLRTRGVTQYRLAADCGLEQSAISKWKRGKLPKPETLILLSEYLRCSADWLLGRSDLT